MKKPCRLEFNAAGSWKLLTTFDAADADRTDDILMEAGHLVDAINAGCKGKGATLRVSTDEAMPDVLMRYETGRGWLAMPGATALLMEARRG